MEIVAMYAPPTPNDEPISDFIHSAASETENPRRNIAKAVRRVFYRICTFYVMLFLLELSARTDAYCV